MMREITIAIDWQEVQDNTIACLRAYQPCSVAKIRFDHLTHTLGVNQQNVNNITRQVLQRLSQLKVIRNFGIHMGQKPEEIVWELYPDWQNRIEPIG